jgi:hypothetical protein
MIQANKAETAFTQQGNGQLRSRQRLLRLNDPGSIIAFMQQDD